MRSTFSNYKKHYKSLIILGVPIIIGQFGSLITGLADTIMVGQHSTAELAAASFVNNVINAFIILGTGFSYNLTPLIGLHLAKNDKHAIGGWLKNSLSANLTTTLLLVTILGILYLNLDIMNQPEEIMPLIRPYFLISLSSVIFVMLANSFRQFVEAIGDPSVSMWVLLTGNILNIIGNYILIYGKLGMPEIGLLGAGISTFASRIIMLALFVGVFVKRSSYLPFREGFSKVALTFNSWKELNKIGWPIGIQQGLEAGTFCITAIMIGWLGSTALAAHQIAITISLVSFTTYLGLGAAVAIRTGYYRGADNWEMVRKITFAGIHLALVAVVIICVSLFLTKDVLSLLFTDDNSVKAIVVTLIPILMLYQIGDSIQIILTNSLRGISDVKLIMWISFVSYFLIAIPAGYMLGFPFEWGICGIWMAYPIGFICSVTLLGLRMKNRIDLHLHSKE